MNVFHKVTLESLKKNRTRTAVTIVGIMLSTALMTAVTTSVSSLRHYLMEDEISRSGAWEAYSENVTDAEYQRLSADSEVRTLASAECLGYAKVDSTNDYKPYLYVMGMGEHFDELVSVHLISGAMPQNSSEILLPVHLAENGGVYYNVGDTITLELGDRTYPEREGDYTLGQHNSYIPASDLEEGDTQEIFCPRETRTYTVCGIMERLSYDLEDFSAPGYTCLTVDDGTQTGTRNLWYTVRHLSKIYDYVENSEAGGVVHRDLIMYSGVSRYTSFTKVVYTMTAILIALIVFGSVALIYNAFAISVSERTKQFGLLSSIGATKKQIRRMVRFEGTCVSAVGIPLGILLGLAGITVTFLCIGSKFGAFTNTDTPIRLHVSWLALAVSVLVSLLTVRLSVWIPSRRATRVTAVEAIRMTQDVKPERRPKRTPKWIYKLFGLPGMLGQKYFVRSHKKYCTTILSLFMSVVLFISASAFTSYLQESVQGVFGEDAYDLRYWCYDTEMGDKTPQAIGDLFRAEPLVDCCTVTSGTSVRGTIPAEQLGSDIGKVPEYLLQGELDTDSEYGFFADLRFLDDESFRTLLEDNGLSAQKYMNPEAPLGVAETNLKFFDMESEKYRSVHLFPGNTCTFHATMYRAIDGYDAAYDSPEGTIVHYNTVTNERTYRSKSESVLQQTLNVEAVLSYQPYFTQSEGMLVFIYPESLMDAVLGEAYHPWSYNYLMMAADHAGADVALRTLLSEQHMPVERLYDHAADRENERNLISVIKVFSYGFIVLISLIAAANVFNSVSTNIALRRREFAMLRSIGMTGKGLIRMMHYECFLYGTRALLLGLPVSVAVTVLIWLGIKDGFDTGFHLPWGAVAFAVFSVFAVVFASMLYAMQKIRRDNPMDALKDENL